MEGTESGEDLKFVKVIEVCGPVNTTVYVIGVLPSGASVVDVCSYQDDELVGNETFGFAPTLPLAELLRDVKQGARKDADAVGGTVEIFEIAPPYGPDQVEEAGRRRDVHANEGLQRYRERQH